MEKKNFTVLIILIALLAVSILKEKGKRIPDIMGSLPLPAEFALCMILLICIPLFSPMATVRGFIYAQF